MKELEVIIVILVVHGLEVNFDLMILVVVIVGVRLCHSLFHEVVVPIEVHADTPLGPPQEGGSEKFLLSHRFSVGTLYYWDIRGQLSFLFRLKQLLFFPLFGAAVENTVDIGGHADDHESPNGAPQYHVLP